MTPGKLLLSVIGGLYLIVAGTQAMLGNWAMAGVFTCYGLSNLALLSVTQ